MSCCVETLLENPDDELGEAVLHAMRFLPGFKFGVTQAGCPVILKAPLDAPDDCMFVCFKNGDPSSKGMSFQRKVAAELGPNLCGIMQDFPKMNGPILLLLETAAHDLRCLACLEADPKKRKQMLDKAFAMYETVITEEKNETQIGLLKSIKSNMKKKENPKFMLASEVPGRTSIPSDVRRFRSHVFAGMAVCSLISDASVYGFFSLASATLAWGPDKGLELALVLRVFLLIYLKFTLKMYCTTVKRGVLWFFNEKVSEALTHDNVSRIHAMLSRFTTSIILPLATISKRQDIVDAELTLLTQQEIQTMTEMMTLMDTSVAALARNVDVVGPRCLISRVVNGQLVQPICAQCCDLDINKKFKMCSKCRLVLYCSRECQLDHWPEHKLVCKHFE